MTILITRGTEIKFCIPNPEFKNGTIWWRGCPILGVTDPEELVKVRELVKDGRYGDIDNVYFTHLGENANGLWAGTPGEWELRPEKREADKKMASEKAIKDRTVRIYLSSRGWGDFSPVEWVGDITRPDQEIMLECRNLLKTGHDIDKPNQNDRDLIEKIKKSRTLWAGKEEREAELARDEAADLKRKIASGYCFSCQTWCYGDCGNYQKYPKGFSPDDLNPETKAAKGKIKSNALLSPAPEKEVSGTPAEIIRSDKKVLIKYPIKDRDFWEIVKPDLGYSWSGKYWEKEITITDGETIDRIAEAGNKLLAAGFPVIIRDDIARALAVSGEYIPRHTRWITKRLSSGRFCIRWARGEDFYSEARKIATSRYDKPYVTVAPEEFKEILDFAEINNFRLSPGALEVIEEQRKIRAAGSVVDVQLKTEEKKPVDNERPDLDPDNVSGDIDNDLCDN